LSRASAARGVLPIRPITSTPSMYEISGTASGTEISGAVSTTISS
jgi:hypothetical protein